MKFRIYLKETPRDDLPDENEWWKYTVIGPKPLWTQIALPLHLFFGKEKLDVFFSPSHYAPRFAPCPTVISIMDLSFLHFPELFTKKDLYQLRNWTAYSVKKATKIFTISEFSKKDIIKEYNVPEDKVVVTYPGYDKENFKFHPDSIGMKLSNKIREKYKIQGDYMLFVGTLQPRKNIVRLIEAFELISKNHADLQLVLAGKKGWMYDDILSRIQASSVSDQILVTDFVADDDMPILYQNARCFVLSSLYEGFGIPVVEAMACGCPVVASNVSSLPEVAGDAGVFVDPTNSESIADGILQIIGDNKRRKEYIRRGVERVKMFSWETCSEKTLNILVGTVN